jgi:hypothetical protein
MQSMKKIAAVFVMVLCAASVANAGMPNGPSFNGTAGNGIGVNGIAGNGIGVNGVASQGSSWSASTGLSSSSVSARGGRLFVR